MRFSQLLVTVLCALVVGGLLAACQRGRKSDVVRTDTGTVRLGSVEVVDTVGRAVAPSGRPLVLKGLRGSVQLTGAGRSTADLAFVRRGRGETRADGQSVLEGISITERGTESAYTYTLEAEKNAYAAVDIRGQVPRSTALRIDRLSGAVHVTGVEGALTITHEHGAVDVQGAAAPVEVTIKNGDVRVDFRTVPSEGPMMLQTSNGDLQVRLPPDGAIQLDAQTDVGEVRTQGLSFTNEQFSPVNAGARYNAQLGEGGPTLELRTENGSITLRARNTTPADTLERTPSPTVPSTDTTVAPRPSPDTQQVDSSAADTAAIDTTS